MFWVISEKTGVPEGLPEPPGEVLGLSGPEGREREKERGGPRPLLYPIRIGARVGARYLLWPASSPPLWPIRPINFPGGSGSLLVLRKILEPYRNHSGVCV